MDCMCRCPSCTAPTAATRPSTPTGSRSITSSNITFYASKQIGFFKDIFVQLDKKKIKVKFRSCLKIQGCIKLKIKSAGEEYQVVKRGMEYHVCGEEYNLGKGNKYYLYYNIEAVGKNIKCGKGVAEGNFGEDIIIQDL